MNNIVIEKLLTIDDTGMPKAPSIRQLQDKDVLYMKSLFEHFEILEDPRDIRGKKT